MTASNIDPVPSGAFRAKVGGQSYEILVESGQVYVNGTPVAASLESVGNGHYSLLVDGHSFGFTLSTGAQEVVHVVGEGWEVDVLVQDETDLLLERFGVGRAGAAAHREIHAPMPGLVLAVHVSEGQAVQAGEGLLVLEAMKMENELRAPADGTVRSVRVTPGDAVTKGQLLVEFE